MIKILIENLEFETIIGLLDFERITPQKVRIDIKLGGDDFMDYAEICRDLELIFNREKFEKVEDSLKFCAKFFGEKFQNLNYFYMKILKIDIIKNADVGAEVELFF